MPDLVAENGRRRGHNQPEYELVDTGVFDDDRYFDVTVEYAKAAPRDILMRVHVVNRGAEPADLHVLPHLWARNVWAWDVGSARPLLRLDASGTVEATRNGAPKMRFFRVTGCEVRVLRQRHECAASVWRGCARAFQGRDQ